MKEVTATMGGRGGSRDADRNMCTKVGRRKQQTQILIVWGESTQVGAHGVKTCAGSLMSREPQPQPYQPGLTNREELSFFTVLAFPKASRIGLACSSCRSSSPCRGTQSHEGQAAVWATEPKVPEREACRAPGSCHSSLLLPTRPLETD